MHFFNFLMCSSTCLVPDLLLTASARYPQPFEISCVTVAPQICHISNQGEGKMLDLSHRQWAKLELADVCHTKGTSSCASILHPTHLLHRRLGGFTPPTCPGRTCTPPGSTTSAPSPSPCTGTSSSHCPPPHAAVSMFSFRYLDIRFGLFI